MKNIKALFLVAAVYDFILGILFFFFYVPIFQKLNITLPVYPMYLQMAAAFVIAMGVGYYFVYRNPVRNVDLIKLGIVYKLVYSGLTSYFYFSGLANVAFMWFAVCDFIFLILFIWALNFLKNKVT
jgi:hypothetical protein